MAALTSRTGTPFSTSILIQRGDRLWSVLDQRWVSLHDHHQVDFSRLTSALPELSLAHRHLAPRHLARRTPHRTAQALVLGAGTLAAILGFVFGRLVLFA